jgi:2-dehydro-3-deoxyphosphogalactonate aldolase
MRELVAILRGVKPDESVSIAGNLIEAGIGMIEVPLNSPDPFDSIERLVRQFGDQAKVGAGTVISANEVRRLSEIGATLVVSPDTNPEVIRATKACEMISMPGVFTPTEAFAALRAGADAIKIFPSFALGFDGFKAMKAVLPPQTVCYAVGGVDSSNFSQWVSAGIDGFGIGSALFKPGDSAQTVKAVAIEMVASFDAARVR